MGSLVGKIPMYRGPALIQLESAVALGREADESPSPAGILSQPA